jgi:ribonucleoside-diphosphate reductase alpha chain
MSSVVEQLFKDDSSDFMTYNKVLARILKKYIHDGEKPESGSFCSECGGELIYQEGCLICMNCGFSKCS